MWDERAQASDRRDVRRTCGRLVNSFRTQTWTAWYNCPPRNRNCTSKWRTRTFRKRSRPWTLDLTQNSWILKPLIYCSLQSLQSCAHQIGVSISLAWAYMLDCLDKAGHALSFIIPHDMGNGFWIARNYSMEQKQFSLFYQQMYKKRAKQTVVDASFF